MFSIHDQLDQEALIKNEFSFKIIHKTISLNKFILTDLNENN